MKYLAIDSNEIFAKSLLEEITENKANNLLPPDFKIINVEADLNKLTDSIKIEIKQETILLINSEPALNGRQRQEFVGIKILKWLRLKGAQNHCVMYSFLPLIKIIKLNPLNGILTSKGVTFVQCPFAPKALNQKEFEEKAERENLLPFFRGEIDLARLRHMYANLYAMSRITEWISTIMNERVDVPSAFMNSYERFLLEFHGSDVITNALTQTQKYKIGDRIRRDLTSIRSSENFTVLFIDDMADTGWSKIICHLIYNKETHSNFKTINVTENTVPERIEGIIKNGNYSLVITDLRLYPQENSIHDYNQFAIYQVIKNIRNELDATRNPIHYKVKFLFFTASNNLLLYQQLTSNTDYAPNGLALKEGIDIGLTKLQSLQNFATLCQKIKQFLPGPRSKKKIETPDGVSDIELRRYELIHELKSHKFDVELCSKPSLVILDTNVFFNQDYKSFVDDYSTLTEVFDKWKDVIWLHSSVVFELEDNIVRVNYDAYGNRSSRSDQQKSEKRALAEVYLELIKEHSLEIVEDTIQIKERYLRSTNKNNLADEYLVKKIKSLDPIKKVFVYSTDRKPNSPANEDVIFGKNIEIPKRGWGPYQFFSTTKIQEQLPKKVIPKNISVKSQDFALKPSNSLEHKSSTLTVKWKDCTFDNINSFLLFKVNDTDRKIKIGKNNGRNFARKLEILKRSEEEFVTMPFYDKNAILVIKDISVILANVKLED